MTEISRAKVARAKIFRNGASQAVRLPAEFRFSAREVSIRRDEATGDVVLSERPDLAEWDELFAQVHAASAPVRFMSRRAMNRPSRERRIFSGAE